MGTHAFGENVSPKLVALEKKITNTVEKVESSVIAIVMRDQSGQTIGSGSGVIVTEEGLVFTAAHVVQGQKEVFAILADQTEHKMEVLGMNMYKDAAVCQLPTNRKWPYAEIGDSDSLVVTDWVLAMGHGRGYDKTRTAPVRFGRVRAHNPGRFLTTDCPLIGGDSGGPLFDLEGNVVAINSSINGLAEFNVHAGVSGFKDDLTRMKKGEVWGDLLPNVIYTPETPVMGFEWYSIRDPRPIIGVVRENSPAALSGIQRGDLITRIADERVNSQQAVKIALGRQTAGNTIEVEIQRGRNILTKNVNLKSRSELNPDSPKYWHRDANAVPRIQENDDSPYLRIEDKPKLAAQVKEIFEWASPLEDTLKDTYVGLYSSYDLTSPRLQGTIIDDGLVMAPYSAYQEIRGKVVAWRPGLDAHSVKLKGYYQEHDLALLEVRGLKAPLNLFDIQKEASIGEFLASFGNINNQSKLTKIGIVSVEKRDLKAFFGVVISDETNEGALIRNVQPGKTAHMMGIRRGDIITRFNGVKINGSTDLVAEIGKVLIGEKIKVEYLRRGREFKADTSLGGKDDQSGRITMMDKLGRNSLSSNRSSFQTVIQSDILVEPEECGSPIFSIDGKFIGIAISDAGRNKSYIVPASSIDESLKNTPEEPKSEEVVTRLPLPRGQSSIPNNSYPRSNKGSQNPQELRQLNQQYMEQLLRELDNQGGTDPFEELNQLQQLMEEMLGR